MKQADQSVFRKRSYYQRQLRRTPGLSELTEAAYETAVRTSAITGARVPVQSCMYVWGPVLLSYICYVLEQAQQRGQKRLYFLARDGYMMYQMAQRICRAAHIPIECRYLYCSRYAWRIPEYHLIGDKSLERICRGGLCVTFEGMMLRAGLTVEQGKRIAGLLHMEERFREPLCRKEEQALKGPLAECREFMKMMAEQSKEKYGNAVSYLIQEGLMDGVPFAIVDSGWIGTMQETLQTLLRSTGEKRELEGYYFGLYNIPEGACADKYHAFYFEPGKGAWRKAHFSNSLFECVYSAPHGMTMEYERKGDVIIPVLADVQIQHMKKTKTQVDLLNLYTEMFITRMNSSLWKETGRLAVYELLTGMMFRPLEEEGRYYGESGFSDDVTEKMMQPLAAVLTERQLWMHHLPVRILLMSGRGKREFRDSAWIEGSICLRKGILQRWHSVNVMYYKCLSGLWMELKYLWRQKRIEKGRGRTENV